MRHLANKRHVFSMLVAGVAIEILVLQAFGVFGGGSPTELAPSPMPLALLYFAGLGPLAFAVPVIAFWVWGLPLFGGATVFPIRSIVLAVAAIVSSVVWLVLGDSLEYYGHAFFAISGVLVFFIIVAVAWSRRHPSFSASVSSHALLFAWLGSFAFPWLGEVP